MKTSMRDVIVVISIVLALWLAVGLPRWQEGESYREAEQFCSSVAAGTARAEAISFAQKNTDASKWQIETDKLRVYLGSGCRCTIRFEKGVTVRGVAMCMS